MNEVPVASDWRQSIIQMFGTVKRASDEDRYAEPVIDELLRLDR